MGFSEWENVGKKTERDISMFKGDHKLERSIKHANKWPFNYF